MSVQLQEMTSADFHRYIDKLVPDYAKTNVESGRWAAEGAEERSRRDLDALLPDGLYTDNHYQFNVVAGDTNETVGVIWFGLDLNSQGNAAHIYDIEIWPEHRRQGYARSALSAAEKFVRTLGVQTLGLHVFAYNTSAQNLYKSLGYQVVSSNMMKPLA